MGLSKRTLFFMSFIFNLVNQAVFFTLLWRETFNLYIAIVISIILVCWVLYICYPFFKKFDKQGWDAWYFLMYLFSTPPLVINFVIPFVQPDWISYKLIMLSQWLFLFFLTTTTYAINLFTTWSYYRKVKELNEFEKFNTLFIFYQMLYAIIMVTTYAIYHIFFKL